MGLTFEMEYTNRGIGTDRIRCEEIWDNLNRCGTVSLRTKFMKCSFHVRGYNKAHVEIKRLHLRYF